MAENPTTEGPVKSLRQAAPGGDIVALVFALIAVLVVIGMIRTPPPAALNWLIDLVLIASFGIPAYVLYAGARSSGLFISDRAVEYRVLGRLRHSWPRQDVGQLDAMSGGLRIRSTSGDIMREFRFRWWRTDQVARLARAAGLAAPSAVEVAARSAAEVDPGEAGKPG